MLIHKINYVWLPWTRKFSVLFFYLQNLQEPWNISKTILLYYTFSTLVTKSDKPFPTYPTAIASLTTSVSRNSESAPGTSSMTTIDTWNYSRRRPILSPVITVRTCSNTTCTLWLLETFQEPWNISRTVWACSFPFSAFLITHGRIRLLQEHLVVWE